MTTTTNGPLLALLGRQGAGPAASGAGESPGPADAAPFSELLSGGLSGEALPGSGKTLPEPAGDILPIERGAPSADAVSVDPAAADALGPLILHPDPRLATGGAASVDAGTEAPLALAVARELRRAPAAADGAATPAPAPATDAIAGTPAAVGIGVGDGRVALPLAGAAAGRARQASTPPSSDIRAASTGARGDVPRLSAAESVDAGRPATADAGGATARPAVELGEALRQAVAPGRGDQAGSAFDDLAALSGGGASRGVAATALPTTPLPLVRTQPAPVVPLLAGPDLALAEAGWGQQFAERVGWVIQARVPQAQLSLNPEHLGPIELVVEVEDGEARVQFAAAQAQTREAIEQSLPRLREMLEQNGLDLGRADVGAEPRAQREASGDETTDGQAQDATGVQDGASDADEGAPVVPLRAVTNGLVDTYV